MTMTPKHPHITVPLTGEDGNAFVTEATAGDYDHLLQTAMRWFDVL